MRPIRVLVGILGGAALALGLLLSQGAGPLIGGAIIISGAILIAAVVIASAITGEK